MTGFHAMRVTNPSPYFESERRAPSTSFQTIRPTRTVAPSAAPPASVWSTRSPKRTRRPVKGRRAGSAEMSAADTESLAVDLRDRLLVDDEHRLRQRDEAEFRRVRAGLAVRDCPEEELLQVGSLARLQRHDDVRERRDRVRVRELLRRVHDRERVVRGRLLVARGGGED